MDDFVIRQRFRKNLQDRKLKILIAVGMVAYKLFHQLVMPMEGICVNTPAAQQTVLSVGGADILLPVLRVHNEVYRIHSGQRRLPQLIDVAVLHHFFQLCIREYHFVIANKRFFDGGVDGQDVLFCGALLMPRQSRFAPLDHQPMLKFPQTVHGFQIKIGKVSFKASLQRKSCRFEVGRVRDGAVDLIAGKQTGGGAFSTDEHAPVVVIFAEIRLLDAGVFPDHLGTGIITLGKILI